MANHRCVAGKVSNAGGVDPSERLSLVVKLGAETDGSEAGADECSQYAGPSARDVPGFWRMER